MCWALENFNKCKEKDPVKEKISLYGWTVAVISLLSASGGLMEVLWLFSSHQTHDERVSSWRSEPSSSLREKAVGNKGRKKNISPLVRTIVPTKSKGPRFQTSVRFRPRCDLVVDSRMFVQSVKLWLEYVQTTNRRVLSQWIAQLLRCSQ